MFTQHSQAVQRILEDQAGLAPHAVAAAVIAAEVTGGSLAETVIAQGLIDRQGLFQAVADGLGWEVAVELPSVLPAGLAGMIPSQLAHRYGIAPLRASAGRVDLLAVDPFNLQAVDDLSLALAREVRLVVGDPAAITALIERCYGAGEGAEEPLPAVGNAQTDEELSPGDIEAMAGQAPIIRFVDLVLTQAVRDGASDIHFEPFEQEFKIRYRIDGSLHEMAPPPLALALPITSRLKVLANLNIAERRLAQDGRIRITLAGRAVDLRVSTLPTQFGESVVLRVLDQTAVQLDFAQLGLPDDVRTGLETMIRRPNGIVIVTGPTGSGKTTTLYGGLRLINTPELKLLTAEDPVEYEIEGIMQLPVNAAIGLDFATALRAFLRQDPDVIMVGEIRDLETAQVAVQASLTGHLVLTTLHTNDAAGTVTRLIDMGVEPFLLASTLEAVLAQRLLRRICPHCKAAYQPAKELLAEAGLDPTIIDRQTFFHGQGCAQCNHTGYLGRMGIFEWMPMSEPIRELVLTKAPAMQLRQAAVAAGMRTLREDGRRGILAGQTTWEEVVRHT